MKASRYAHALILLAVFGALSFNIYNSPLIKQVKGVSDNIEETSQGPKSQEERYQEARSRIKDIRKNHDGTYTAKVFTDPVQYQDQDGNWQDIDPNLKIKNSLGKESSAETVSGKKGKNIYVDKTLYAASLSTSPQSDLKVSIPEGYLLNSFIGAKDVAGEISGNKIVYDSIYPEASLERIFNGAAVKQNIILNNEGHPTVFKEKLDTNFRVEIRGDNSIVYWEGNEQVAVTPKISIIDAKGKEFPVSLNFQNNILEITIKPETKMSYPAVIDPTFNLANGDAYITNDWAEVIQATTAIHAGGWEDANYDTGIDRSILRFNTSAIGTNTIASASLNLHCCGDTSLGSSVTTIYRNTGTFVFTNSNTPTLGTLTPVLNTWSSSPILTSYINKTGYTWFSLRGTETSYTTDTGWDGPTSSYVPYLSVTYVGPPLTPTNPGANILSSTSIRWNWTDASNDETGFRVHDASHNVVCTAAANATSCDESNLTANTQYSRHIHSYNGSGDSVATANVVRYTKTEVPISPAASPASSVQINITWAAPAGGTNHYHLKSSSDNYATNKYDSTGTGYSEASLAPNTQYTYRIYGVNADNNESATYATAVATTLTSAPVLNSPTTPTNDTRPDISNSSTPDSSFVNSTVNLYDGTTKVGQTRADGTGVFNFGDNKATNGGFETDSNSDGLADGWTKDGSLSWPAGSVSLSPDRIEGSYSQRINFTPPETWSGGKIIRLLGTATPVGSFAPGESATGSFWLKGTVSNPAYASITMRAMKADGTVIASQIAYLTIPVNITSWTKFSVIYPNLPAETSRVRLDLGNIAGLDPGENVDLYLDNVQLDNYNQNLNSGTHSFTVKALNSSGTESSASNTASVAIDTVLPTQPTTRTAAKVTDSNGADIDDSAWNGHNNGSTIYFAWSGAADPDPSSGIKRYWVYFGPLAGAVPRIDGQATVNATATAIKTLNSPVSGTDYYLRVQTEDLAGNISSDASIPTLFVYKFDNTQPNFPAYVTPSPAGWSTSDSFNFSWPVATDANSGLNSYEYKRENDPEWTSTTNLSVSGLTSYQNGINYFLLRTLDNAGNRTTDDNVDHVLKIPYYYSNPGALVPQNLQVDLTQTQGGTVNSFKFIWDAVNDATKYYYSVNETPDDQSSYVAVTYTEFGAFATRQGQNTFYLVAENSTGAANWSNPATVSFSLNTVDPTAPSNISVSDSSNRNTNQYALTIMWVPAESNTTDFSHYVVQRSEDNLIFANRATVDKTNTGYLDTGLTYEQNYYYRVLAKDNVGNLSQPSEVKGLAPTGKYATAPTYTSTPEAEAKATSATISWSTDRSANTIVEYGLTAAYGQTQGSFNNYDTNHSYELTGLSPGTTYNFRVQSLDQGDLIGYSYSEAYLGDFTFTTSQAPGISDVVVSEVRLTSAIITWKTTSSATSKILYGKTSSYGSTYIDNSGSQTTTHTVKVEDLTDSTVYNFKIQGTDIEGNILNSDNYVFETLTFPKITNLELKQVPTAATSTVELTFSSNVPTTSLVTFSGGNNRDAANYDLVNEHKIVVSGLLDNTTYTVTVKGRDQYGNEANPVTESYKTDFDTRPPKVKTVTTETEVTGYGADAKGQIIISWETDEPSTSQIEYGIGSTGNYTNKTQEDTSLSTTHVVVVSELKSSSPYHFRVVSKDNAGNEVESQEYSTLTPQASRSIFDAILSSLDRAIGWLFRR